MLPLTELEVIALQEENKRLQAENDCLVNYFDRARSLQCSLRGMVETVTERGAVSSWGTFGGQIQKDYYLLTDMLGCIPAFNVNRDQLKDTLEGQIRRAAKAESKLSAIEQLAKDLAEDIELEGMKSLALTRYNDYASMSK